MVKTYYRIPPEGVRQFLEQYVLPRRMQGQSMTHDSISVVTDSHWDRFDFLTEVPIAPLVDSSIGPEKEREFPGPDYLGQFTLVTHALMLDETTYNNGKPQDPRLVTGFRRLAELFKVDIPVE